MSRTVSVDRGSSPLRNQKETVATSLLYVPLCWSNLISSSVIECKSSSSMLFLSVNVGTSSRFCVKLVSLELPLVSLELPLEVLILLFVVGIIAAVVVDDDIVGIILL